MEEQEALELYERYKGKYQLKSKDYFLSAMRDPKRASNLYSYLTQQGEELPYTQEQFIIGQRQGGSASQQAPAETGSDGELSPPKYSYSWSAPLQEADVTPLLTGRYDVGASRFAGGGSYEQSLQQAKKQGQEQFKEITAQANRRTREELQDTFADNEIMQRALSSKNASQAGDVGKFVTENFQEAPEELQQFLIDYLYHSPVPKINETLQREMDERTKARLLEDAVYQEMNRLGRNQKTYQSRLKLAGQPDRIGEYAALAQYKDELMAKPSLDERGLAELKLVSQEIEKYEGTDEAKFYQDYQRQRELSNLYKSVIRLYPEELKRRQRIQDTYQAYIKIQEGDSKATQAAKQIAATAGSMTNAGIDAVIRLAKTSKTLSDQTQSLIGREDVGDYNPSDMVIDEMERFVDDYFRVPIDRAQLGLREENEFQVVKDGRINREAILPSLARSVVDMVALLGGARYMGGGNFGLVASGYATNLGESYEQGIAAGLDSNQALNFAQAQSIVQAGLELVSPQRFTRGLPMERVMKNILEGGASRPGVIVREMLKEVPEEVAQEMLQLFAEKGIDAATQQAVEGSRFQGVTADEAMETVLMTILTTAFVGGMRGNKAYREQFDNALNYALDNKEGFKEELEKRVQDGLVGYEEAQAAWNKVLAAEQYKDNPEEMAEQLLAKEPDEAVEDAMEGKIVDQQDVNPEDVQKEMKENLQEMEDIIGQNQTEDANTAEEQAQEAQEAAPAEDVPAEGREEVAEQSSFTLPDSDVPAPEGENRYPSSRIDELFEGVHDFKKTGSPAQEGDILFIGEKAGRSGEKEVLSKAQLKLRAGRNQSSGRFENIEVHRVTKARAKDDPSRKTEKIGSFSIVPDSEVPTVESSYTSNKGEPITVRQQDGQWYRVRKDGKLFKNPIKNQKAIEEAQSNLEAQDTPAAQTTETTASVEEPAQTQQSPAQRTEPKPQKVEDPVTPTERETKAKAKVGGRRLEKGEQVSQIDQFKEGEVYFRAVRGRDIPYTFLGTSKRDGKDFYVFQKQGSKFKDSFDPRREQDFINEFFQAKPDQVQQKIDSYQAELDKKAKEFKDAFGEWISPGAVFDPENENRKAKKFFKALSGYAKAWLRLNAEKGYQAFLDQLPKRIREYASDDMLEAAYSGENWEPPRAEEPGKTGRKKERKAAKRIAEDKGTAPELAEDVKANTLEYFTEPNRVTDAAAESLLASSTPSQVSRMLREGRQSIPVNVQVMLALKLVKIFNKRANSKKYADQKELYLEEAAEIANWVAVLGTDLGRGVQAFRAWSMMTPEGVLLWTNRMSQNVKDKTLKRHRESIDNAQAYLKRMQQEAAKDALAPKKDGLKLFGFSTERVKKEKKKVWDKLRKRVRGRLFSNPLDPQALVQAVQYGFWTFLEGTQNFILWSKKMRNDLNIDQATAAAIWEDENTPVGRSLSSIAEDTDLASILASDGAQSSARIQKALEDTYGLDSERAEIVAQELTSRYTEAFRKKLRRASRRRLAQEGIHGKMAAVVMDFANQEGPINRDALQEALIEKYGANLTPEATQRIQEMAQELQALPEGVIRDQKTVELMNLIRDEIGERVPVWDLVQSLWYARILAGPATQVLNIGSNFVNLTAESFLTTVYEGRRGNLSAVADYYKGMARGLTQGALEGWALMKTGNPPSRKSSKFFEASPLEQIKPETGIPPIDKVLGTYLSAAKMVPRFMSAIDTMFYWAFYNSRAAHYAHIMAREEQGLSKREQVELAQEIAFGMSYSEAMSRAEQELANIPYSTESARRLDTKRRARELMLEVGEGMKQEEYQARMEERADRYASFGTFNYPPEGVLGAVARGIQTASRQAPPLKLIVPFTTIVANVLNQQLDYSPVGLLRAVGAINVGSVTIPLTISEFSEKGFGAKIETTSAKDKEEAERLLMKGTLGTIGMAALMALGWGDEGEDSYFMITGKGPSDYNEKRQLYERGWKPFSIKIGDKYYSYIYVQPLAFPLTIVGNTFDAKRYDGADDKTTFKLFKEALAASPNAILEMSFLKGLAEFFEAISDENRTAGYFERFGARTTATNIPVLGSNFVKTLAEFYDPTIYEAEGFTEKLMNYTAFMKSGLKPAINSFGDVMEKKGNPIFTRFISQQEVPKEYTLFVKNNVFVPGIGRTVQIKDNGESRTMTRDELYMYQKIVGQEFKKYILSNYDVLDSLTKKQFESAVKSEFRRIRDAVKARLTFGESFEDIMKSTN